MLGTETAYFKNNARKYQQDTSETKMIGINTSKIKMIDITPMSFHFPQETFKLHTSLIVAERWRALEVAKFFDETTALHVPDLIRIICDYMEPEENMISRQIRLSSESLVSHLSFLNRGETLMHALMQDGTSAREILNSTTSSSTVSGSYHPRPARQ